MSSRWPWGLWALGGLLVAAWLAFGGLFWIALGGAALEALCIELAAIALATVSVGVFLLDREPNT